MTTAARGPGPAPIEGCVRRSGDEILVRDEQLFGAGRQLECERFLACVFGVEGVRSVAVDRARATAAIQHKSGAIPERFLGRLAAALRECAAAPAPGLALTLAFPQEARASSCTLYRQGMLLSTCEVLSDRPGRLQLRHEELDRDHVLARQVEGLLARLPGVRRATFGTWSNRLVILYDDSVLTGARVIRLVEEAVDRSGSWGRMLPPVVKTRFTLANVNLAIAGLADFAVPALTPLSAVLLVGANLRTFRLAWLQVHGRKVGLPVLSTVIVMGALASGHFLASALASWFFKFWRGRLRSELRSERRRLLDECLPRPRFGRLVTAAGGEVLVPIERLRPGDVVNVGSDEAVPADGRIVAGGGIVDERSVRGLGGASRKRLGDQVLAGSIVLAGSLRIEVALPVERARATTMGRLLVEASSPAAGPTTPTLRAEAFADRTVGPTLATAGLGLLVGDLTAAGAILQPDYATGPALAFPLEILRDAALCARSGIVVRSADAFERLSEVNVIVLDDDLDLGRVELELAGIQTTLAETDLLRYAASAYRHLDDDRAAALMAACRERGIHLLDLRPVAYEPGVTVVLGGWRIRVREYPSAPDGLHPLLVEIDGKAVGLIAFTRSERPAALAALGRIRALGPVTIALVSARTEADVAARAALLGVDLHVSRCAPEMTARLLRDCRQRGLRTAFIGRCRRRAEAADEAHVAISVVEDAELDREPAAVLLTQPRLELFANLWGIARSHEQRLRVLQRLILVPNVLCVAGAFFLGATSLTAVVLSNLGTFGLYSSAVGALQAVEPQGRGPVPVRRPRSARVYRGDRHGSS
jgi:cation transport ATPase